MRKWEIVWECCYYWINNWYLLMSHTCATSPITSWCSTKRWCSAASFFPSVFGNSLSQKMQGTWSSVDEISFAGCSGKTNTSKACCWWWPVKNNRTKSDQAEYICKFLAKLLPKSPLSAMFITQVPLGARQDEKGTFHLTLHNWRKIPKDPTSLPDRFPVPANVNHVISAQVPNCAPIFEFCISSIRKLTFSESWAWIWQRFTGSERGLNA